MGNQAWLDNVREQLARHDLAPSYVQRFLEELGDHLEDLRNENLEADVVSRLGEPEQVVNAAVAAYRRRSFLGRHAVAAFLVFAISPVIAQCALFFLAFVFVEVLARFSGHYPVHKYHWITSLTIVVCSTFLGTLYGELATGLGIGKKWLLASCAAIGVVAMFWEFATGRCTVSVMLLVQFAAPLAVAWSFTKRKYNHRYAATKCLVFAVSPIASLAILWLILFIPLLMIAQMTLPLIAQPLVAMGLGPAALIALTYTLILAMLIIPTAVASLLYSKLTRRFGSGRKWTLVSCTVLASFAATATFRFAILIAAQLASQTGPSIGLAIGLALSVSLAQFLTPFAIAWWFMRRKHDQDQLQLAS